jgi:hypothetical protein
VVLHLLPLVCNEWRLGMSQSDLKALLSWWWLCRGRSGSGSATVLQELIRLFYFQRTLPY